MWSLLLVGLIEAAPPVVTTEVVEPIVLRTDAKRGRRRGGKKGQSTDWGHEFYARPAVGGSSYTGADGTSTTAIAIGGQGGVRYWQKKRGN